MMVSVSLRVLKLNAGAVTSRSEGQVVVDLAVEYDDVPAVTAEHRLRARGDILECQAIMAQPDALEQQLPVFGVAAVATRRRPA